MANPDFRFTIKAENARRVFLSVSERKNSDVTLFLKHADYIEHDTTNDNHRIITQKYSLHYGSESPQFSTLKQTIELKDGKKLTTSHVTSAIKGNAGRFALLYFRIMPDPRKERYKVGIQDKATIYNIDEYDPSFFTFCHAILVGSSEHAFPATHHEYNVNQHVFGKFRIVQLWNFLTLPSADAGRLAHYFTLPPELADDPDLNNQMRQLMDGIDPRASFESLNILRAMTLQAWLSVVSSRHLEPNEVEEFVAAAGFVREASLSSPEMLSHIRSVRARWDALKADEP